MLNSNSQKYKLLLVNPIPRKKVRTSHNSIFSRVPPLSLGIIASLTPDHWEVEILDENFEEFSFREADLVGFTACTTQANRVYQIAETCRAKGIPTVMGGIHASMLPDEALMYVDSVVIGEAESVWKEVISHFESGNLQSTYRGEFLPMEGAPVPRYDLFDRRYMLGSIQTSRGCPHECDFCSVSALNGRVYRKRPVKEVLDELQIMPQKRFVFVDDNLFGKGKEDKDRAISLFQGMIERKINKKWGCQVSINEADDEELLFYASKAGCKLMIIGVESENEASLMNLGKNINIGKLARYNEVFKRINKYHIAIFAALIFGMDTDSIDDLHSRVRFINKSRIDTVNPSILTPYPGTKIYERLKESGRLLNTNYPEDWNKYDMTEVLYKPALMTDKELRQNMIKCWKDLFNGWNIFRKFIKTFSFTKSQSAAFASILSNIMVYRAVTFSKIREWKEWQ